MKKSTGRFIVPGIILSLLVSFSSCTVESPPSRTFDLEVVEGSEGGTLIGDVSVADPQGLPLTYTIIKGNTEEFFTIGESTGIISLTNNAVIDYESKMSFVLEIAVSNNKSDDGTLTVNIDVMDIDDSRYLHSVFSNYELTTDVAYASESSNQKMNIYQPAGDNFSSRSLVILVPGGGFDRTKIVFTQTLYIPLAERLARAGYVVAILDYRTEGPASGIEEYQKAFIYALYDLKGAIRFFNKDSQTTGIYKTDPENVFIMGYSAGAQIGLYHAYRNSEDEYPGLELDLLNSYSGIEGNSGNEGYSSDITGLIAMAGNMTGLSSIKSGDPALFCIHGTADTSISIDSEETDFGTAFGSRPLIARAEEVGIPWKFLELQGHNHLFVTEQTYAGIFDEVVQFIYDNRISALDPEP